ncbi:36.4 kDa proline-rich protein [Cryptomeria japonica]|uniref:36.4 kDa proline-rich protein n=1 Tax=Cryptomeria japonica TaxID=3369 RepID=UPI0027DA9D44|nr:36.4 kDa proline-rich protein [Cryptomeria japonica]
MMRNGAVLLVMVIVCFASIIAPAVEAKCPAPPPPKTKTLFPPIPKTSYSSRPPPPTTSSPPPSPPSPLKTSSPPPPASSPSSGNCPLNALKLGACVDVLGGLVNATIGDPAVNKCCPFLQGVLEIEAALCLCTTIRLKLLNLNIILPIALELFVQCGLTPPAGFRCPPLS